jgi:hypothetical protein
MQWLRLAVESPMLRVRSGLLLFVTALLSIWLYAISPIPGLLSKEEHPGPITVLILLLATIALVAASLLLKIDAEQYSSVRLYVAVFAAVCIALSVLSFMLFAVVPFTWIGRFSRIPVHSHVAFAYLDFGSSFGGRSKSRVAMVAAATVAALLWGPALLPW